MAGMTLLLIGITSTLGLVALGLGSVVLPSAAPQRETQVRPQSPRKRHEHASTLPCGQNMPTALQPGQGDLEAVDL
jgi:hypothetical protein